MAYDEDLANRIREVLANETPVTEKRMFGGLAFMVSGHMAVAAIENGGLMVRIDPTESEALLDDPNVQPMVMGEREVRGWLQVAGQDLETDDQLGKWVARGVAFAHSLPPKS